MKEKNMKKISLLYILKYIFYVEKLIFLVFEAQWQLLWSLNNCKEWIFQKEREQTAD